MIAWMLNAMKPVIKSEEWATLCKPLSSCQIAIRFDHYQLEPDLHRLPRREKEALLSP